jgi:hypothetical protein
MRSFRLFAALAVLAAAPASAQTPDKDVIAVVNRLFDGMRTKDTASMRALMHEQTRLISTGTREGQPVHQVVPPINWLRGIPGSANLLDERLYEPEARVDGSLATVWVRYDFYSGQNFSHCGYDAFQLLKVGADWKILQTADTRRRGAGMCPPGSGAQPTQADTAAVVATFQRLFDAMRTRDTAAARKEFVADGQLVALNQQGAARFSPAAQWAASLGRANGEILERMVNPEVRISDNLATIWTWYDLHIGERFSHCGIDTAQLVKTADGWKITSLAYTTRQSPCEQPRK